MVASIWLWGSDGVYSGVGEQREGMTENGPVWSLGAMSGTSLDGVDAALVLTDGETIEAFDQGAYREYEDVERAAIRAAFGPKRIEAVDAVAGEVVETAHADLLSRFEAPDLIGFHGQTLYHNPSQKETVQIGDGGILAEVLGHPVVWDFRSADVAMGGQGAPLAPFFHHACARKMKASEPLAFLNLGGVGNLTWVDPRIADPAKKGALLAFDTGPANAPINDLVAARWGAPYDKDGRAAMRGNVSDEVVARMLEREYFKRVPPKSLDRNHFSSLARDVADLSDDDAAATLTCAAAAAVAQGLQHCPSRPEQILVTGGGRLNPTIMAMLRVLVDCPVEPIESVGFDGDLLEAQAFAFLAVRVSRGLPTSSPSTTGVPAPIGGGLVSRPGQKTERV